MTTTEVREGWGRPDAFGPTHYIVGRDTLCGSLRVRPEGLHLTAALLPGHEACSSCARLARMKAVN